MAGAGPGRNVDMSREHHERVTKVRRAISHETARRTLVKTSYFEASVTVSKCLISAFTMTGGSGA